MYTTSLKNKVISLRTQGKTYAEICRITKINIPKSTLAYWCKDVVLPKFYSEKVKKINKSNLNRARKKALATNKKRQEEYLKKLTTKNKHLNELLLNNDTAKIALAMLYLGEGSKNQKSSIMFGNSNDLIIRLFLRLLRQVYDIDETKFRCTVQCRADQDEKELKNYWSQVTSIPLGQFYRSQIDKRTLNKPSKKPDYKGVCRIDYFSGEIFHEMKSIFNILNK